MGHSSQDSVRVSHDLFDMLMQIEKEAVLADLLARVTSDRTRREALVNELRGLWDLRRIRLHPSQTARS